jgi:hypothetical protein
MPATAITGPVCAAILTALRGATAITAVVPVTRITDEAPSSSVPFSAPLILVESHGEQPFNTLGAASEAFGSSVMVGVRVISQQRADTEINSLTASIRGVLDGLVMVVPPFIKDVLTYEGTAPIFKTSVGGIPTREQVSEFDLTVHQ